jgi:RecG-like helicase
MKKSLTLAAAVLFLASATRIFAADETVTITGEGMCAKCALHETKTCQNAIQVQKDGKTVTYYLVQNDVSKNFHENLCKGSEKVKATGTVKEVNGKMEMTATKIEAVK